MKNKGFTLVEMIGVIVILGLLAAFSVPALTKILRESADKQYNEYVKNITMAAENYFHSETDGKIEKKVFISVGTLVQKGYLKKEINPKTNTETLDTDTIIISKNDDGTEKYEFVEYDVTEDGYVSDGLLLHFDGYTAPVNYRWSDLSGNNHDGILVNFDSSMGYQGDSIYTDGIDDYIYTIIDISGSEATVEIVYKFLSGTYVLRSNANVRTYIKSDVTTKGDGPAYYASYEYNGNNKLVTLFWKNSQAYTYQNGQFVGSGTFGDITNGTYIAIHNYLKSSVSQNVKGYVYSVRAYDHALSEQEIKQNYNVDKVRFDIED